MPNALVEALPVECGPLGPPPTEPVVTFTKDGHLYSVAADGTDVRCLTAASVGTPVMWGARGDRVIGGSTVLVEQEPTVSLASGAGSVEWSRPTGTSIVYVEDGRLWKRSSAGGERSEISFLARHEEVVYHPAGTHIAVVGEDASGVYGIFLATNLGTEPDQRVQVEVPRRITSLTYVAGTGELVFVAEHDDGEFHLHRILRAGLGTPHHGPAPIGSVVPEPREGASIAFREGACNGRTSTGVVAGEHARTLDDAFPGLSTEPVGWVSPHELVVLARESGCDGQADLYSWRDGDAVLLLRGVDGAAVRAVLPPPPEPPTQSDGVVA